MISGVSDAALRQSREIEQLARTIQDLDRLTQDNAGMVGTCTRSAGELRGESQRLAALMTRFKLPAQDAADAPGVSATRDALPLSPQTVPQQRRLR